MSNFIIHSPADIHETLMAQLPGWFKPVLEYIAIMRAWSFVLSSAESDAGGIKANFFVQTCDEETLRQWEKLLRIRIEAGDTIEFRRERVMNRLATFSPFTYKDLQERLTQLFGEDYTLEVNAEDCYIKIFVSSDRYGAVRLLRDLIHEMVPVHLYVYSNQQVVNIIASDTSFGARLMRTKVREVGGV